MRFLGNFSKAEAEKCDQEEWNVSDGFGIVAPCSATYHLELVAPISLKAATKASVRGKKNSEDLDFQATFLK